MSSSLNINRSLLWATSLLFLLICSNCLSVNAAENDTTDVATTSYILELKNEEKRKSVSIQTGDRLHIARNSGPAISGRFVKLSGDTIWLAKKNYQVWCITSDIHILTKKSAGLFQIIGTSLIIVGGLAYVVGTIIGGSLLQIAIFATGLFPEFGNKLFYDVVIPALIAGSLGYGTIVGSRYLLGKQCNFNHGWRIV